MFRKLISNISFSPALVGQLGFYARRLKNEEATRRLGLVFTVLALIVQSFVVFAPPEPANAASDNDIIRGGVSSTKEFLSYYDRNAGNLKDTMNALGITRDEIAKLKTTRITSTDDAYISWGRKPYFSAAQGEKAYTIPTANGTSSQLYARPLNLWGSYRTTVFAGYSAKVGWFGIMKNCGNLVTKSYPVIQSATTKCPEGTTGVYPDCTKKQCPSGSVGEYPNCSTPLKPTSQCNATNVVKSGDDLYRINATSTAENGASVKSYTYIVYKDGKEVFRKTIPSSEQSSFLDYSQRDPGTYRVEVVVQTSLGERRSENCAAVFVVPEPERCDVNPDLLATDPKCQPCPNDSAIWIGDEKCKSDVIFTKSAKNITQNGVDATTTTAKASDRITYTLNLENKGPQATETAIVEHLDDVVEYATVIEPGGGTFDPDTAELSWPSVTLKPGEKQSRMFTVELASKIPAAARGTSNRASYDCAMINTFGNATTIDVDCPNEKYVESVATQLPQTGSTENILIGGFLLAIVTYFYARARLSRKEVRLIRRNLNAGSF